MGRTWKTLMMWVVLIVLFLIFYKMFEPAPGQAPIAERHSVAFGWGLPVLGVAVFAGLVAFFTRRNKKIVAVLNQAFADIGQGRAAAAFAALQALKYDHPSVDHYRGVALLALWRIDEAIVRFNVALAHRYKEVIRPHAEPQLRLAKALRGDTSSPATDMTNAADKLADAIVKARSGAWSDVLSALTLENIRPLGGRERALAETIRAWALEESGEAAPHPDLVGVLGETGPDAVRKYWPEFASFLERSAR